jgi:hypothetical protein
MGPSHLVPAALGATVTVAFYAMALIALAALIGVPLVALCLVAAGASVLVVLAPRRGGGEARSLPDAPPAADDLAAVWIEGYEGFVGRFSFLLDTKKIGDVPGLARESSALAHELWRLDDEVEFEEVAKDIVAELLPVALALALPRAGFVVEIPRGGPVRCVRGDEHFEPFAEVSAIARGEADPHAFAQRLAAAGVADQPLVAGRPLVAARLT